MKIALLCTLIILVPILAALIVLSGDVAGVVVAASIWVIPLFMLAWAVSALIDRLIAGAARLLHP